MNNAAEVIAAIGGLAGLVATLGGGAAFIWNKVEARFTKIEGKLAACEKREDESHERRATLLIVIELLWAKVKDLDPDADVLGRAKDLLDKLKRSNSEGH
jgi:hypothetical protein